MSASHDGIVDFSHSDSPVGVLQRMTGTAAASVQNQRWPFQLQEVAESMRYHRPF